MGALSTGVGAAGAAGGLTGTHACVCKSIILPAGHCGGGAALATEETTLAAIANAIDSPSASSAAKSLD